MKRERMYRRFFKKLIDRLVALFLLIVLSPLMAVVALAIYLNMGSPILFRQKRPGEGEKIFTIYKFRTMSMERDENGELLPDERRLGPLGRRLRSLSLDELPQLFNIVKGDMSFVGPRPLLDEYLPLYDERQRRRHEVTPGITGWAQVNGRNAISWKEKFEYDLWYVEHQSFSLDMKILWMTLVKVLRREGIAHEGSATMEKFRGNG
jgi:lipopolysaccharide/colanic/teichoic acid biosynthesis glycosyltransferase